jgi:DNA invertase Pin-like site-specific DNA recombinase
MVDAMDSNGIKTLVGGADADDPIAALYNIAALRQEIDRAEASAVRRARNLNISWQYIATALGVSRQAVHKKFGRK